jgi:hypothetical protein
MVNFLVVGNFLVEGSFLVMGNFLGYLMVNLMVITVDY